MCVCVCGSGYLFFSCLDQRATGASWSSYGAVAVGGRKRVCSEGEDERVRSPRGRGWQPRVRGPRR